MCLPINVDIRQAKKELSSLVARALAGEEVIITRAGKPVVRLAPVRTAREPGSARGLIEIADDFEASLPEEAFATSDDDQ